MEALYETIRQFIVEAAEIDDAPIDPHMNLMEADVDSLAGLEVTVNLERKFQIKIPPARYSEMTSIHAIAAIVQEQIAAKSLATSTEEDIAQTPPLNSATPNQAGASL